VDDKLNLSFFGFSIVSPICMCLVRLFHLLWSASVAGKKRWLGAFKNQSAFAGG
jgi:hypothetical protein